MTSSESRRPEPVLPLDWARHTGQVDAVRRALESKLRQRRQRRARMATAVAALLLVGTFLTWAVPFARDTGTIATAARHRQALALTDGSLVELNAQTKLHTDFRYGRRIVRLAHGEAFFTVAKDAAHPFVVETPAGSVRVTGTRFNVRVESDAAIVTLEEGAVLASRNQGADAGAGLARGTALKPNEQLTLAATPCGPRALTATEMENALAWRTGRLVLDGLTLGEAAARFAAYHGIAIELDPATRALSVGGSCPLDDLPGFMDFVKEAFPVNVLANPDGSFRVVAR